MLSVESCVISVFMPPYCSEDLIKRFHMAARIGIIREYDLPSYIGATPHSTLNTPHLILRFLRAILYDRKLWN